MKNLEELRVVDLRNELEKRGLDKSGIKATLLERLRKAILDEGSNPEDMELHVAPKDSENRENCEEDVTTSNKLLNESIVAGLANEDPWKDPGETFDLQEPEENCQSNELDKTPQDLGQDRSCKELQINKKISDDLQECEGEKLHENKLDTASEELIREKALISLEENVAELVKKDVEMVAPTTETSTASSQSKEEGRTVEGECQITREDYVQRMEDDSINLLLEDDDKMLDYEENDRIDMDDGPPSENKGKTDNSCEKIPVDLSVRGADEQSNDKEILSTDKSSSKSKSNDEAATAGDEKADKKQSHGGSSGSRNLWVSGLASNTRAQDLKSLFCKYGKVLSAKIVTNAKTPGARCYGFVTMAAVEDAAKCITHLNRTELHGKLIQVEKAKGEPGGPLKVSPLVQKPSSGSTKDKREVIAKDDKAAIPKRESEKHKDVKEKEENQRKRKSVSSDRKEKARNGHDRLKTNRIDKKISNRVVVSDDYGRRRSTEDKGRLPAKDRVVDRRHEVRRGSRDKRSPPVLSLNRIVEERERHRVRSRGRQDREEERRRRDEELVLKKIERIHKEEAESLRREREKLRLEREKIEQQKQDLIRMEREQQRLERERLERERNELRKQQIKYEEGRRGVKRPSSDHREYFNDRKRGPSRISERSPERNIRVPSRSLSHISDKAMPSISGRSLEQGHLRSSDRMTSNRGLDRQSDRGNRYNDSHRESRYPGNEGSERGANASSNSVRVGSHYDERRDRDREERRPLERSVSRSEDRGDHRTPPPPSLRSGRLPRDNHYNGSTMATDGIVDVWRSSVAPKNAPYINNPNILAGVGGTNLGSRGVEVPSNWKPSSAISTNERWGGNSGTRNANIIDPYRISGQVPMSSIPMMSNMMQSDRFGQMGSFRK